ncbi:MAG: YtxH domain-containing protein [Candidatus Polarisedimenticolia bacterium]
MNADVQYGNGGHAFFTFLTGALLGVGLGMLFAPKTGKDTRRQLAEMARNAQEKATDMSKRMKRRAEDMKRRAEEGVSHMQTMGRDTMGG